MVPQFHYCCSNSSFSVPTLAQVPKITDVEMVDTVIFHSAHDKKAVGFRDQRHL